MRGKFLCMTATISALIILSGCTRMINSPADELKMYSWQGELENSSVVTLDFDGSKADLSIDNEDFDLDISGLCAVSYDTLIICDENTEYNYKFGYKLYGDRVELTIFDGTISLKKL